jgi:hypothetical protein
VVWRVCKDHGEHPNLNDPQYDYRSAWKAGVGPNERNAYDGKYHWPSSTPDGRMLKGADHPTAWMEYFMRKTGIDPQSIGLKSSAEGDAYILENSGGRR